MVQCDVEWHDGTPVAPSPRQVLKAQVEKAHGLGLEPMFGSELEFFLFRESYLEAHAKHYHDLTPSVPYILDYHVLAASFDEPFLRSIRTSMKTAGMVVESSKGEAWAGQHEINFRFADALRAADDHVVYKNGIKEIAFQQGCSVTFMAKPHHDWVGSSCHIHSSLWREGENAFAGASGLFRHYLAGQIACMADLAIFVAPTINSYKRFSAGSWAPTTLAWGYDNRTCGFRVVGHGSACRPETRIPGADANPYLAFAALLAAGDGLMFSGGKDLPPGSYGAEPDPATNGTNPARDSGELALLTAALERDLPVLAICRGAEVLNVARGGDLVQHLPDVVGHEEHRKVVGEFSEHPVSVDPSSRLDEVRGPVKSHHHQGLGRLG